MRHPTKRFALLAVLPSALLIPLLLGWFPQEGLRTRAELALQAEFPGSRIGSLHIVPALLSAEIGGLRIEAETFSLEVAEIRVGLTPSIFGGAPSIRYAQLREPELIIEATPPAVHAETSPPTALPFPVRVSHFDLSGGRLSYRSKYETWRVEGIEARGGIGTGELSLHVARAFSPAASTSLGTADARIVVSPLLDVTLAAFDARIGRGTSLQITGPLGNAFDMKAELDAVLGIELADWIAAGLPSDARGVLHGTGQIVGGEDGWSIVGSVTSEHLVFADWPIEQLEASASLKSTASLNDGEWRARFRSLGGNVEIDGSFAEQRVEARLDFSGIDTTAFARVMANGQALPADTSVGPSSGSIRLSGALGGALQVDGLVRVGPPPMHVQAGVRGTINADSSVDLLWNAQLANSPGLPVAEIRYWRAQLDGSARGALPPEIRAYLKGQLGLTLGTREFDVGIDGQLRNQGSSGYGEVVARLGDGTVSATARIDGNRLGSLDLVGDELNLSAFHPDLGGELTFALQAFGSWESLTGSGHAQSVGSHIGLVELGDVRVLVRIDQGSDDIAVFVPALGAQAELRGALPASTRVVGTFALTDAPLAPFLRLSPAASEWAGVLSGDGTFDVPKDAPLTGAVTATLSKLDLRFADWPITLRTSAAIELSEGLLRISQAQLDAPGVFAELSASTTLDESAALAGSAEIVTDLAQLQAPEGWIVDGTLAAQVALAGSRNAPLVTGLLDNGAIEIRIPSLPAFAISASTVLFDGNGVDIPGLTASVAAGTITVSGRIPFPGTGEPESAAELLFRWRDVDAAHVLEGLTPEDSPTLSARLSGEARLRGEWGEDAFELDAHSEATQLDAQGLGLAIEPFDLSVRESRLTLAPVAIGARGERFVVQGEWDMSTGAVTARADGDLALRALNPFLSEMALGGRASIAVAIDGTLERPAAHGSLEISDATLRLQELAQPLTSLSGRIDIDAQGVVVDMRGLLGGGDIEISGGAKVEGMQLTDVHFEATGRDIALQYPEGFKSRLDADLQLSGPADQLVLGGTVTMQRGLYDVDMALRTTLFAAVEPVAESALLRSIRLDLAVETVAPIKIHNNLARLDARGRLSIRGNLDTPAPYGRLEILPGGKVFLQTREFVVDQGTLTYTGDFDPGVSVSAQTQIRDRDEQVDFDVTIEARGSLEAPQLAFRSQPSASEREIVSLIATGRTADRALSSGTAIAAEQVAALLASRLTSDLSRGLESIGLDDVSIQPQLLAREGDPTARFTIGKRVTDYANLVYSLGLGGPEERFIRLELEPVRKLTASVQRDDLGLVTYGLGQRLRFGDSNRSALAERSPDVRLESVRLEGEIPIPEPELHAAIRSRAGRKTNAWKLQDDAERMRERLVKRGYVEAQVGVRLDAGVAVFIIRPGARFSWRIQGTDVDVNLDDVLAKAFHEEDAIGRGRDRILEVLRERGYLYANVTGRATTPPEGKERVLTFEVVPGPTLTLERLEFAGVNTLKHSILERATGGAAEILTSPDDAIGRLREVYRSHHFLAAQISEPETQRTGDRVSIRITIDEGPGARIATARISGAPSGEPSPHIDVEAGQPFSETAAKGAADKLRAHYLGLGYPAADVAVRLSPAGQDLDVVFEVSARERVTIGAIEVVGLRRSRESLVRGRLPFAVGDPLDPRQLIQAESRLMALGVFSRATIHAEGNPATLRVEIAELPKFSAAYDVRYNEEERTVGLVDGEAGNLLGSGLTIGARVRAGKDVRELRGSLFRPSLWPGGDLTLSVFREQNEELAVVDQPDFGERIQLGRGVQLQQNLHLPDLWNLLYGYSFSRITDTSPFFPDPLVTNLASLDVGAFRDSRDHPLDPQRGRFFATNVRLAVPFLGSDTRFIKGYTQAFFNRRIGASLLWAHGYRLGLAHGFEGRPIVEDERFFAGGANSVRGYEANSLGPRDRFTDLPIGGEATMVINQELRFRHEATGLGAVVFWDAGNVYDTVGEFDFDLRHALGIGARYSSPVGLLRLDWAFPLGRKEDESAYRFHFSIGQAF